MKIVKLFKTFPFLHTPINEEILRNISITTWWVDVLIIIIFQCLRQAIKNLHTKTNPNWQLPPPKKSVKGHYFLQLKYTVYIQVLIMLHFIDILKPIYPIKHTVKSH